MRVYCGTKQQAPDGYDRIGTPFQCLRKGYGVCLYSGKKGTGQRRPQNIGGTNSFFLFLFVILLFLVVFLTVQYFIRRRI